MTDAQAAILTAAILHLEETVKEEGKKTRQLVLAAVGLDPKEYAQRFPGQSFV